VRQYVAFGGRSRNCCNVVNRGTVKIPDEAPIVGGHSSGGALGSQCLGRNGVGVASVLARLIG